MLYVWNSYHTFTYIWLKFIVHVGKYSTHGAFKGIDWILIGTTTQYRPHGTVPEYMAVQLLLRSDFAAQLLGIREQETETAVV